MFITISGTPGTGKTSVAKILGKRLHARLITTNYLLRKYKIKTKTDRKRKTKIVDEKKLANAAKQESKKYQNRMTFSERPYALCIFEGHLAHFAPADIAIILRTSPRELEKRLKRKRWNEKKTRENVEAEAVGVIAAECAGKNIVEVDTTGKSPESAANEIIRLIGNPAGRKKKSIDWSKEYADYLT